MEGKLIEKILTDCRTDVLEPILDELLADKIKNKFTYKDLDQLLYEYQLLVEQRLAE
ncbi:hypothetical protein ACIQVU_07875 [Lysinibacillus sp. NPDC098008]|uniref:hypothetical protein n=1 Tax=Lysinibacillus sp. NPDC098008 TaxID=3364146 RepID=UPI0038066BA7